MEDSPVQTVVYESLPDSPVQIQYQDDDNEQLLIPQRKQRRGGTRITKPDTLICANLEPPTDYTALYNNSQRDEVFYSHNGDSTMFEDRIEHHLQYDNNNLFMGLSGELGVETTEDQVGDAGIPSGDDEFSFFLDAVLAEECGLFQLTERLFVANGWNISKRECTVRRLQSQKCVAIA